MGTKFSELWKDPQFIDPEVKEKVNIEVELIEKLINARESESISQKNIDIHSINSPKSKP